MKRFFKNISLWLAQPKKIFFLGFGVVLCLFTVNGHLWQLWSLYHQRQHLKSTLVQLTQEVKELDSDLKNVQDIEFIEYLARDRFDLVKEGDLVFIFSEVDKAKTVMKP